MLKIALTSGMDALDEVAITVQDESGVDHWGRGLPSGVTQEKAETFVWGPWEFDINASAGGQQQADRPRPYSLLSGKNRDILALAAARPGSWMTGASPDKWRKKRRQQPLWLQITCRREGHNPWFVPLEVQPGYRKTGGPMPPEAEARWNSVIPLGRMGDPSEIRGLALLLASPAGA